MRRFILSTVAATWLVGCQSMQREYALQSDTSVVDQAAATVVANDLAKLFAQRSELAASSTVRMERVDTVYSVALESALKGQGYAVVVGNGSTASPGAIEVHWSIEEIDGQILAQLGTASLSFSRVYSTTEGGAIATSPLSILARN